MHRLARARSNREESQPQIYEETNALALVVWSPPQSMPGIPLVSREANYSRDSDVRVHLSEEEQRAAEESLARYCPLLEFYNILKHRAGKNPSFLTRCLSYKLKDKHKKRVQISVSINKPLEGGRQTQSLFPLYILLARPVLTPNGETLRSSSYRFKCVCKLPAYREVQTVASPRARFVLPEINKLSKEIKSGSLVLLLVSCADVLNPTVIYLTKDHMFTSSYEGYCLMGKIPIDFLQFSREQSRNMSLGVRAQFTSTVSLKSCYMKLSSLDEEKCASFQFPRNSEAVSILQQVPVSITAEELGAKDLTRYDLHSYNNIPTDKLSQVIRLRKGNVIFNYKYYNNMLHKSEVTEDYCCPICLLKCASYKGLRYHLPAYHDHFNYEFWVDDNYQAVILSPAADAFTSEGAVVRLCSSEMQRFGRMIDARESHSFCRKPLKSRKSERRSRNPNRVSRLKLPSMPSNAPAAPLGIPEPMECEIQSPNAVVVSRAAAAAGISSSGPESTPQSRPGTSTIAPPSVLQFAKSRKLSIERSDPRNKTLLQKGSFFHSHTGQPMSREYVFGDEDSEDEVDDDVADLEDRRMLDDFIDVTPPEKKMMHLWNSFKRKQGVLADAHVPWACEAFSTQHGEEFVQTPPLLWCWRLFLIKLWHHGLLDAKVMNRCNLIIKGFQDQNQSQAIDLSGNES
ncbi:polycomb group protein EMBRYONIC FLOWER 2-like [Bidens hawaiensis]|uniref:polycomb group protein EMBRYONIC FLOWER 2-like n=1 Tax=Bidens hawaiensis TaxID=980011 RepID=UPI00404A42AC